MDASTPENFSHLRRRMILMIVATVACFLVAAAAMVGYLAGHIAVLGPVFVAAIATGVAAQVWFIAAFARSGAARKA